MLTYFFSPFGRIGRLSFFLGGFLGVILLTYFLYSIAELILQVLARAGIGHTMDLSQYKSSDSILVIFRKMYKSGDWADFFVLGGLYLSVIWVDICLSCKRLRDMNWPLWIVIVPIIPYATGMIEGLNEYVYYGTSTAYIVLLVLMLFYPSQFDVE